LPSSFSASCGVPTASSTEATFRRTGPRIAVSVELPGAYDEAQARLELALYLRVWEAVHPGSGAELLH
jgi:hypothetical protein